MGQSKEQIQSRTIKAADMIKQKGYTLRQAAKQLNVSKSTVFHDIKTRLPDYNQELFVEVINVLKINAANGRIAGGEATKEKWRQTKRIKRSEAFAST